MLTPSAERDKELSPMAHRDPPPGHVFREYDIRGVADRDLDDGFARALGRALLTQLRDRGAAREPRARIAVGRDCRLSSERLFAALARGLTEGGADVIDVGVGPTPLLYFAAHHLRTDGAVMITGSHNPPEDNGFKLMSGTTTLFGPDVRALGDIMAAGRFAAAGAPGSIHAQDLSETYLDAVRAAVRLPAGGAPPRIAVDAGNGAAGPLGVRALRALGVEVDALYCDMDGRFPNHHPDPTVEENVAALRAHVVGERLPLGIAWDGDGDRIGVVDEAGEIVWGDKLLIVLARALLAEHPGAAVLGEVKCSETLFADVAARGGRPVVCRTGHSLIKQRMREEQALLAGEMSGHLFFADRWPGFDDAIYAAARLLEVVTASGRSLRELLADVPLTFATPEIRVPCPDELKFEVVARVLDHYRGRHRVLDVDGARVDFGEGAWGLCRASNTGPVLVLRFEARAPERRDEVRADVETTVTRALDKLGAPARAADRP
jgi:phosphomannomutase/phosphoglucomutase